MIEIKEESSIDKMVDKDISYRDHHQTSEDNNIKNQVSNGSHRQFGNDNKETDTNIEGLEFGKIECSLDNGDKVA